MKYLLCALILIGAFFSLPSAASDENPCAQGEVYNSADGLCGIPAPESACTITSIFVNNGTMAGNNYRDYQSWFAAANRQTTGTVGTCSNVPTNNWREYTSHTIYSADLGFTCPETGTSVDLTYNHDRERHYTRIARTTGSNCTTTNRVETDTTIVTARVTFNRDGDIECPDSHPIGPRFLDTGEIIGNFCFRIADRPPCDCTNLQGRHAGSFDGSLVDTEGRYSHENPPPCINVSDANGNQCPCGVVSNMWHATPIGATSTLRWTPFGGTFTGGSCGDDDTGPGERETCFTLANGTQWCLGDPNMDCQEINGMQQCRPGCGYFNDDFVCYDIDDPGKPDPDDTQQNPIDDNISDPNKPIQDMIKGDFKDVQRGTEQRLDNINITLGNQNNRLDGTNNRLDQANSKLDGIGRQLDGMGKELKGIGDTLGDAFGDDGGGPGDVDGNCTDDGICSWYESAYPDGLVGIWQEHSAALEQTAMFNFLNQFQINPSGSAPDMSLCFNLGRLGDYGCHSLELHPALWGFLFICIQITAAFTCRRLIFGG